ncbi:hypothetical protein [Luteimonas sp. MC1572]|uniref:hypothetical protein n=1 Tax=Luteimonas sp. MC1572 TaxID=2799325 RepID=UPI0018F07B9A|nr:hypothetical protein [Luteimonas sp. MC1572]MBJ6982746.1 hypothetical protein [Luteimonas sp. MC1572]QQO03983.1 hypothetical protein JGR64_04265 [Luteimonas sp. MC1572]
MDTQQDARGQDAAAPVASRPNFIVRCLHWYWGKRDEGEKGNPVSRTFIALALVVVGVLGAEAYQYVRGMVVPSDPGLEGIKQQQAESFGKLQDSLDALAASVGSGNRDAMSQVKGAVDEIRHLNSGLIARLTLATAENARMSQVVGLPEGLDIILTPDAGMSLDAQSEVGVQSISSNGAYVSVVSRDGESGRKFLRSGESIGYTGGDGRSCRVTLRSVDPRSAVSLSNRCS